MGSLGGWAVQGSHTAVHYPQATLRNVLRGEVNLALVGGVSGRPLSDKYTQRDSE